MKLLQFDLRAYGQYKNKRFDLDPTKRFQVIYGSNESGKTTFSRAFLALLFGIDKKSPDSYLTDPENLYLEGLFEMQTGKLMRVVREHRLSRKMNSELQSFFPSISKARFEQSFILNNDSLYHGSKDLLDYLRRFDVTLFDESHGHSVLKKLLKNISDESSEIFKERGTNPKINQLFHNYQVLREQQKTCDLSAENYETVTQRLNHLESAKIKSNTELSAIDLSDEMYDCLALLVLKAQEYKEAKTKRKRLLKHKSTLKFNSYETDTIQNVKLCIEQTLAELAEITNSKLSLKNQQNRLETQINDLAPKECKFKLDLKALNQLKVESEKNRDLELLLDKRQKTNLSLKNSIDKELLSVGQEVSYETILLYPSVSSSVYNELVELDFDVRVSNKRLVEEKLTLLKKEGELTGQLSSLSNSGFIDSSTYKKEKLKREQLGIKLAKQVTDGLILDKKEFGEYQICIQKESGFTESLINETDQFLIYKETEGQLRQISTRKEELAVLQKSIDEQEHQLTQTLQNYSKSWNLEKLTFSKFKSFAEKLPSIKEDIEQLQKGSQQEIEETTLLDQLKEKLGSALGSKYEPTQTFKDNFNTLLDIINEGSAQEKQFEINKEKKKLFLSELADVKMRMERALIRESDLRKKWAAIEEKYSIEVVFDEKSLTEKRNSLENDLQIQAELRSLDQEVLGKIAEEVKRLYKKLNAYNFADPQWEKYKRLIHSEDLENLPVENLDIWKKQIQDEKQGISQKKKDIRSSLSEIDQELGKLQFEKHSLLSDNTKTELDGEVQDLLYHLQGNIEDFLTINMAGFLLKQIVWEYQNKYQVPIIERTSSLFNELTQGRYHKIKLNLLDRESFLSCVSGNSEVSVESLSQGTRDQLFFALKLALYEHLVANQEPLPLLLDDILVQFDDQRAVETLKVLHKLSTSSQILFLTHHTHLVDLVKKTLPESAYEVHSIDAKSQDFLGAV